MEEHYQLTREALKIILHHRFPVHIITKSDLVIRDFDLLKEIEQKAILPEDLKHLQYGTIISFSFSSILDEVARIFEPGATRPSKRLVAVKQSLDFGFLTGISMMPLIPYISDTTEQLELSFSTFKNLSVDYVLPASITLFGNGSSDSKTLTLNAIKKHYPHLIEKYERFFKNSNSMPLYYQKAFKAKMTELHDLYGLEDSILLATKKKLND